MEEARRLGAEAEAEEAALRALEAEESEKKRAFEETRAQEKREALQKERDDYAALSPGQAAWRHLQKHVLPVEMLPEDASPEKPPREVMD